MLHFAVAFTIAAVLLTATAKAQGGDWVWVGGSNVAHFQPGDYGTRGVAAPGNQPAGRYGAASATDSSGKFWMFGGIGAASVNTPIYFNDLWELDPITQEWTSWSGSDLSTGGVYGIRGVSGVANVPGSREGAVLWTDRKGNVWLFGGWGLDSLGRLGILNDLWKFDPSIGQWSYVAGGITLPNVSNPCFQATYGTMGAESTQNVPGGRQGAVGWTDETDGLWLFGGDGCTSSQGEGLLNDVWHFDPEVGQWTWVSGLKVTSGAGVYGTLRTPSTINTPGARWTSANLGTDGDGNFWLFGGQGLDSADSPGLLNDLWEFNPATAEWTWQSGSMTVNPPNVYGIRGQYAAANMPGGRIEAVGATDNNGKLWVFGGVDNDLKTGKGNYLNDLWTFDKALKEWAWVSGGDTLVCLQNFSDGSCGAHGGATTYGTLGVLDASNVPGGRDGGIAWMDTSGDLWLFGGIGVDSVGNVQPLNDLWKYDEAPSAAVFGTMTFSPSATEPFGTSQAVTISDILTYFGVRPTGAVTYSLNGVNYTAVCTTAGSPATCSATVPAATIAALAVGAYPVTGSLAGDEDYAAVTTRGTFTVSAGGACRVPDATNGTMNVTFYTLDEHDNDVGTLPGGLSSNYVLPGLGSNGLPVYNPASTIGTQPNVAPSDLSADGEITWWSPTLHNAGTGAAYPLVQTSTGGVAQLPLAFADFYPPNGTGLDDRFKGLQTAVFTGTLVAPAAETVSFTIGSDDMAFLYLDGQIACDDGGVHSDQSVPCTTSTIAAGTHTLQLFYSDLKPTNASLHFGLTTTNVAVGAGDQLVFGTMTFSPTATVMRGTSETISVADTLFYSGPAPTGAVAFVLNDVSYLATCSASESPATCTADVPAATIAALPASSYTVTGSFAGDCNYARAAAPSGLFTVTRNPVVFGKMTFSPAATVVYGTSEIVTISDTLTYPVVQADTPPTGAVKYLLNGVTYPATCTTSGSPETCTAAVPAAAVAALSVADYTVAGSFAGDANYLPATAASGMFTVTIATTATTLNTSATTLVFGQSLTLKGTVTSPTGGIPAGTVTFLNGGASLGGAALNGAGVAMLTLTPAVGTYSITAAYGGSGNDMPSASSPAVTVTVTPAPTTATLTSSLNPAEGGSSVTFTISVQSGAGPASGSVILADGSAVLAALTLNAVGAATYTTSTLSVGAHPLTASYAGDASFIASQGSLTQVILPPPDFSIETNGPLTLATQHHGPTTVTVTPVYGFSGLVTLSCGDVPAYVTCEWGDARKAKESISVAGVAASTGLQLDTSAVIDYLASSETAERSEKGFALAGAMFVPLLFLLRERRTAVRLLLCIFAVLAAMHVSGCSSRYPASTPPGTYSITIQGVSGELKHSAVLTLVVTQ